MTQLFGANVWPVNRGSTPEHEKELITLGEKGAKVTRISAVWEALEPTKGTLNATEIAKLDAQVEAAVKHGQQVILTVAASPTWAASAWNNVPTPISAYGAFCGLLAKRYGSTKLAGIEIWNEPNGGSGPLNGYPVSRAKSYTEMTISAYAEVHPTGVPVIMGAMSYVDTTWLSELYTAGIKGHYDSISIHPYADGLAPNIGTAESAFHTFKGGIEKLRARMLREGDESPVWVTEFGWEVGEVVSGTPLTQLQRATYINEAYKIMRGFAYVAGGTVYEFRDKGDGNQKVGFGMVNSSFVPYEALTTFGEAMAEGETPEEEETVVSGTIGAAEGQGYFGGVYVGGAPATSSPLFPPTVTKPADQDTTVGVAITLSVTATGTTEYKASGLPTGLSINAATGVISGTPTVLGAPTVTLTVKGPRGEASTTFKWTVEAAPTITKPATQTSHVSAAVSLALEPAGQFSYKATGLPAGLSINEATGLISGTPTTVSSKTVTVKAFNAAGAEASTTFTWAIEAALAPTVVKPADQNGNVGTPVAPLAITATNTTEYSATGLPGGLGIDPATGHITGTPTTIGAAKVVTITVKGPGGEASTTFTWEVGAALAPTVAKPADQVSKKGKGVTLPVVAINTTEYKAAGLPEGLSIDAVTGRITGVPTTIGAAKVVTLTVQGPGGEASTTFNWTISAAVSSLAPPALRYFAYDFLTGAYIAELPIRGVQFTRTLNGAGTLNGAVNLYDPRVRAAGVLAATSPNKTLIVADWNGQPVWHGISQPRKWDVDSSGSGTTGVLSLSYAGTWAYWQQRIQATDYSSPPYSGITGLGPTMNLWTQTPWFAPLIACQVMQDALAVPYGNPLGGTRVTLNGETPSAKFGLEVPGGDLVAVNYPYPSLQTVESIVSQLSQLGLGVGFDFAYEVGYAEGKARGQLQGRFEVDWPWRGAVEDTDDRRPTWRIDLAHARKYSFPEDGSQTGWQIYEVGGTGAIFVESNVEPPTQGYPLLERVMSRSSIQSPQIMALLALNGLSDLSLFSYAPVTPVVTLGLEDTMLPFGQYEVGDLARLRLQPGEDPRFPDGMDGVWRLTSYTVDMKDEGDPTVQLTFAQPCLFMSEVNGPAI